MTKHESKLLARWPQHHSRGIAVFVLYYGVLLFALPFVGVSLICRFFIFHHHPFQWDDGVYMCIVGFGFGVIRSLYMWSKMERFYGDLQRQNDHVAS
jgi:drug/metabolite transporter (DMT)-like permease